MTSKTFDTLVVGAGQSGAQTAISLRMAKYEGTIGILGNEDHLPYERPPLSKDYLMGEKDEERLKLRPDEFWEKADIEILTGQTVTYIDPVAKSVRTKSGEAYGYKKLVWATGGNPRQLELDGSASENVYTIRTLNDVQNLKTALAGAEKICVIGGGYIGLEAAAVLRKLGKGVTVIEVFDRVLSRVAGPEISSFYRQVHEENGVRFVFAGQVDRLVTTDDLVSAINLKSGLSISCDLLIVGIGIIPAVEPLKAAGAEASNGVDVDEYCRTSLPDIYAIGDCANHKNKYAAGHRVRLESVQNAIDQAKVVAMDIAGKGKPYNAIPWFWSDQYDLKLQTMGLSLGHDTTVLRGTPETRAFSLIYMKEGRVIAADCVNAPADYVGTRMLIMLGKEVSAKDLADTEKPLKHIIAAAKDTD